MLSSLLILIPWLRRFLRPAVRREGIRLHAFYIRRGGEGGGLLPRVSAISHARVTSCSLIYYSALERGEIPTYGMEYSTRSVPPIQVVHKLEFPRQKLSSRVRFRKDISDNIE